MGLAPKKTFDPDAYGTLASNKSNAAIFGGGGNIKVNSDSVIPETLFSGSGSIVGEKGNVIICEKVDAISIITAGPKIRQLLRGIKITIPDVDTAVSGTTTTLVLPSDYDDTNDGVYASRPVRSADTYLYIKQGTNEGQIRKVSSYDSTTRELTVESAFDYAIDATSEFELLDAIDVTEDYGVGFEVSLASGDYFSMDRSPFILVSMRIPSGAALIHKAA